MALPITVPYTFGSATTAIPLSNLDSDYATVYQAVNGIGNGSVALANVTITGGTVSNVSGVVPTPFTANGVVYASSTSALATGSALTFDGTNLGIGTSSPTEKLQVAGALRVTGVQTTAGTGVYLDQTSGTGGVSVYGPDNSTQGTFRIYTATANGGTGSTKLTLDTSGNLGLGVTPSAWGGGLVKAFELSNGCYLTSYNSNTTTQSIYLGSNNYYNGSNYIYKYNGYAAQYQQVSGQHNWYTASSGTAGNAISLSQVMTLDASGRLLVGTTSAFSGNGMSITSSQNTIWTNCTTTSQYAMVAQNSANSTGTAANFIAFNVGTAGTGTTVGSITYNGTSTVLNPTSDVRLKENISDSGSALDKINAIRIRSFNWKSNNHFTDFGVIAQELVEVAPECVKIGGDEINEDGELQDPWCAQPYVLVPAMIKAIQEQQALIVLLKARLDAANL